MQRLGNTFAKILRSFTKSQRLYEVERRHRQIGESLSISRDEACQRYLSFFTSGCPSLCWGLRAAPILHKVKNVTEERRDKGAHINGIVFPVSSLTFVSHTNVKLFDGSIQPSWLFSAFV